MYTLQYNAAFAVSRVFYGAKEKAIFCWGTEKSEGALPKEGYLITVA